MLLAGEEGFSRSWRRFGTAPGRAEARCLGQPDRIYSILHWVCCWHRQCLAFPSLHISQWRWYVRACNRDPYVYLFHGIHGKYMLLRYDRRIVQSFPGHDETARAFKSERKYYVNVVSAISLQKL